jgi:Uma2 family endonuclease
MSGAKQRHNHIVLNLVEQLRPVARQAGCSLFAEDIKLRAAEDVVYYPDLMVVCRPMEPDSAVTADPCLVIEVTSPSTAAIDRREKLAAYRRIASVQSYLIVNGSHRHVQRHWRGEDGASWVQDLVGEGEVPIPCPALTLTLDAIYEGLALPPLDESSRRVREDDPFPYAVVIGDS